MSSLGRFRRGAWAVLPLYADRSHYCGARGLGEIPAYSRQGAVRAHVRTLQKRLPQELRLAGITAMRPTASSRRSCPNTARFALGREGSAFVSFAGALDDILWKDR